HERVSELAALVDRARRLGSSVTWDPAREGELAEKPPQPLLVVPDVRVDLAIGALEIHVGHDTRAAMAGSGHVEAVQVSLANHAVEVGVDEVQPGRRPPVPEQAR